MANPRIIDVFECPACPFQREEQCHHVSVRHSGRGRNIFGGPPPGWCPLRERWHILMVSREPEEVDV